MTRREFLVARVQQEWWGLRFSLIIFALGIVLFAVTLIIKGWHNSYLISLSGFAVIAVNAFFQWRRMRQWFDLLQRFDDGLDRIWGQS